MADNLGHKAAKLAADKSKAAHPTTLSTGGAAGPQRKKTPAFQITSVTVVNTRPSTDGGDDSADDLDESHTDDTSDVVDVSRVTDVENETPSFSEDTFSKEDVFFNAATASLGSAPVIPTSSQYGLALLGGEGGAQPPASAQQQASEPAAVAPDSSAPGKQQQQDTEMRDVHATGGRNERFKVVKIESTVPFKRGRWTCMDYLDHSTLQNQQQAVINVTESGSVKYCGTDSGVVLTDNAESHEPPHHQQQAYGHQNLSAAQTQGAATVSPGQTLQQLQHVHQQGVPAHLPQSMSQVQMPPQNVVPGAAQVQQQQHQSLPPHQFQQVIANAQQQQAQSYVGQQSPVIVSQQPTYYTPPASGVVTSVPLQTSGVSTLASAPVAAVSHPQVTVVPVVSQVQPAHHSSPVVHVASQPQMEQKMQHVPVQQIPIQQPQVAVHQQPQVAMQQQQPQVAVQQQQPQVAVQQQPVLQQHQMQHPGPQIHLQQAAPPQTQPIVSAPHLGPQQPLLPNPHGLPPTSAPLIQPAGMMTVPGAMMAQSPLAQMQTVVMQPTSSAPVFVPHAPQISVSQPNVVPVALTTVYQNPSLVGASASLPATQWTNAAQAAPVGPTVTVAAVEPVVNPANNPVKETSQQEGGAPLKVDPSDISKNSDDSSVTVPSVVEDTESASGTSAVAIDNKIEQAMDLVKSHLMFAVREEVEVLKERIAELMDRIGQLEMENTILKAHATQEALAQLGQQQQPQQQPAGNGSSAS